MVGPSATASGCWWWKTRSRIVRRCPRGSAVRDSSSMSRPTGSRASVDSSITRRTSSCSTCCCPACTASRCAGGCEPSSPVPIVMVSAVDTELDVVLGLELGAAGYVTKPFRLRELVARMQAILRRVSPPERPDARSTATAPVRRRPGVQLDRTADRTSPSARSPWTSSGGRSPSAASPSTCPGAEFDLLAVLLTPVRRVRTRDELIDLLWPDRSCPTAARWTPTSTGSGPSSSRTPPSPATS